jgi:transposase
VRPPSVEQEGLRDLMRCREDIRRARAAARHQVAKQRLGHGRVFREGKKSWTLKHWAWVRRQRLDDPLAQRALEHALAHLDSLDAQLAAIDSELEQVARTEPGCDAVRWLTPFRGIGTRTALALLAEIGDCKRFGHPRELMSYLGLTPSEYSSGDQQHRGHITKAGNEHARRLLIEAACTTNTAPAVPDSAPTSRPPSRPAPGAPRSACTTATAASPPTASAAPWRPSPSPASSAASCGPP